MSVVTFVCRQCRLQYTFHFQPYIITETRFETIFQHQSRYWCRQCGFVTVHDENIVSANEESTIFEYLSFREGPQTDVKMIVVTCVCSRCQAENALYFQTHSMNIDDAFFGVHFQKRSEHRCKRCSDVALYDDILKSAKFVKVSSSTILPTGEVTCVCKICRAVTTRPILGVSHSVDVICPYCIRKIEANVRLFPNPM